MNVFKNLGFLVVSAALVIPGAAAEPKAAPPIARLTDLTRSLGRLNSAFGNGDRVIRSAAELVAFADPKDKAEDRETQDELTATLARFFRVKTIDWDKQMVVSVCRKDISCLGRVEIDSTAANGRVLTVRVLVDRTARRCPGPAVAMALVDRWTGEVKFVDIGPPADKGVGAEGRVPAVSPAAAPEK